jgi:cell division cycle 2-like protein
MTSKTTSRWAAQDDGDSSAADELRREKEEKKRIREEKARKAAAASAAAAAETPAVPNPSPLQPSNEQQNERPTKRQRMSQTTEQDNEEGVNMLHIPNPHFGPCGHVDEYEILNDIEQGSYGLVSRARTKASGEIVALKRLKMEHTSDGFPVTGLREIQTLMACRHANVLRLLKVVMGDNKGLKE